MSIVSGSQHLETDLAKIIDKDERVIGGWATVYIRDKQGDLVPLDELEKALTRLLISTEHVPLLYEHSNKPVGKVLRWERRVHPETGKEGIWIIAKIYKGHPLPDKVWEMIKKGQLKGFSIAGQGTRVKSVNDDGSEEVNILKELDLYEISIVSDPANPKATVEYVNHLAKSDCPKGRYTDGDKWRPMTCPGDLSGRKRPICGCIRYFMNCVYEGDIIRATKKCLQLFENGNDKKAESSKSTDGASNMGEEFAKQPPGQIPVPLPEKTDHYYVYQGEDEETMVVGIEDLSKHITDFEKDSCKDKYFVCNKKEDGKCVSGHFKNMKCPDGYGPNRFCGCVNYFKDCRGLTTDQAKRMCYKICVDKYGEEYCSGKHGRYVKKSEDNEEEKPKEQEETEKSDANEPEMQEDLKSESGREQQAEERTSDSSELLKMIDELRASISKITETLTELTQRVASIEKATKQEEEAKPVDPVGSEPGQPMEINKSEEQAPVKEEKVEIGQPSTPKLDPEVAKKILTGEADYYTALQQAGISARPTVVYTPPPSPVSAEPKKTLSADDIRAVLEGKKRAWEVIYQ